MSSSLSLVYSRLRENDPKLTCVTVIPAMNSHLLANSLLSNASLKQLILGGSQGVKFSVVDFAELLECCHHLPLVALDASSLDLSDAHMTHVFAFLRSSKTIRRLDISRNRLSLSAAKLLGDVLARHPSLQTLDLAECRMGDMSLLALLDTVTPEGCTVQKLNLAHNLLSAAAGHKLTEFVLENSSLITLIYKGNFIVTATFDGATKAALERNLAKQKKPARPNSALGFLSSVEPEQAPCPSLNMLSKEVEREVAL